MKKLLSLVLVLSLVLGSFGMAFAAPSASFTDVENADVARAVDRLKAFGIVDGYEDGTFRPENPISREEFSKLLVEALGLGSAADAAMGTTQFTDVPANWWSAGFVNVAAGQNVVRGDAEGTFRPQAQVTYAEALTMLVRALGYQDSFLGANASNWQQVFTARAAQLGITSGVRFTPNAAADRGTVAVLLNNTLDTKIIKQVTFGSTTEWQEQDITLMEERLDIEKLEEVAVVSVPRVDRSIEIDQMGVEFEKDLYHTDAIRADRRDVKYRQGDYEVFDIAPSVDLDLVASQLGLSLNVYVNDRDEVIYFEESDRPFRVMYDVIDWEEVEYNESTRRVTEIELRNLGRSYDLQSRDGEVVIYVDNEEVTHERFNELATNRNNELFAKVVLNRRGNIKLIDAHQWDGGSPFVVTDATEDTIHYFDTDEDDDRRIRANSYDKVVIFDMEGNLMEMEDLRADDVIYINDRDLDGDDLEEASSRDEVAYILVVRNTVEGKFQSYREHGGRVAEVEVSGKTYDVLQGGNRTTVSIDNDDTIEVVADALEDLDDLSAVEGEVLLLLDAAGDVRHIRGGIESSSRDQYGVITAVDTRFRDVIIKVLNENEDVVEYELDLDRAYGYAGRTYRDLNADGGPGVGVNEGDIIRFTVNSKGDINEIQLLAYLHSDGTFREGAAPGENARTNIESTIRLAADGSDIGRSSIRLHENTNAGSTSRFTSVKDDVKVFNVTPALSVAGNDFEDVEAAEWDSIVGKSISRETLVVAAMDTRRNAAEAIVFLSNFDSIGDDAFVGYVTSIRRIDGDGYADIVVQGTNTPVRFELNIDTDYDTEAGFRRRALVGFVERSNGKVEARFNHEDLDFYTGKVGSIRGNFITLVEEDGSTIQTVRVNSSTVYYEKGNSRVYNDISEGDYIRVALNEGVVGAVKIYDINERDVAAGTDSEAILFFNDFMFDNLDNRWSTDTRDGGTPGTPGDGETEVEGTVTATVYNANTLDVVFDIVVDAEGNPVAEEELVTLTINEDSVLIRENGNMIQNDARAIRLYLRQFQNNAAQEFVIDVLEGNIIDVIIEQP